MIDRFEDEFRLMTDYSNDNREFDYLPQELPKTFSANPKQRNHRTKVHRQSFEIEKVPTEYSDEIKLQKAPSYQILPESDFEIREKQHLRKMIELLEVKC